MYHTLDTYSEFQWKTALSLEKVDSSISHLLEVITIMWILVQIKSDNTPAYVSSKMNLTFAYFSTKYIADIPNPIGQAII